ncbi:MAG TPA: hypothetical protein VM925_36120 [Labilithrix sp.]|nr:hypothetical protein [Labilithrix sp.]
MAVGRGFAPATFALLAGCNLITGATDLTTGNRSTSTDRQDARSETGASPYDAQIDSGSVDMDGSHQDEHTPDDDAPSEPRRRVFVTSMSWSGNLGGLPGADNHCNTLAGTASLDGDWVAWVSGKDVGALDRLTSEGPWYLVDGKTLAVRSRADLQNDSLAHPIDISENGVSVANDVVWTGTRAGKYDLSNCNGWTSSSSTQGGMSGSTGSATATWTANIPDGCGVSNRLYCFEK